MAPPHVNTWRALLALALLAASTAQEARAGASLSQERERELRILAAESGLDVSGVADEEELLARIANHPPTMRALRERIELQDSGPPGGSNEAGSDEDSIQIDDLDDEEDESVAQEQAYMQSSVKRSAFHKPASAGDAVDVAAQARERVRAEANADADAEADVQAEPEDEAEAQAQATAEAEARAANAGADTDADGRMAAGQAARAAGKASGAEFGEEEADEPEEEEQEEEEEEDRSASAQATSGGASSARRTIDEDDPSVRVLDSVTTKVFTLADSDDDLRLSPRQLLDAIVSYGQLLLNTHGCTLPSGIALTMKDLSTGVKQVFRMCDTDGDGLLSLLEARADECRAHLLSYMDGLSCTGERAAAAPVKAGGASWVGLLGAQQRFTRRVLAAWTSLARGVVDKATGALESSSPLGRSLVTRLRAVPWKVVLPKLRMYALWLSVGLTYALCSTTSPSGEDPYPQFESSGARSEGQDAADAEWVDDD